MTHRATPAPDGRRAAAIDAGKDAGKNAGKNPEQGGNERTFPPGIGAPALRALTAAGLTSLDLLVTMRESELLAMHGLGPKAVRILRDAMHLRGLSFKS